MSCIKKVEASVLLEQTHHRVLSILHESLQKEAKQYSKVLHDQPFFDYFYEDTPIMYLAKKHYLDKINYYSQLIIKTRNNDNPYIGILLTIEAYFPPLYARAKVCNIDGEYDFLWNSVDEMMDKISYSTKWTVSYKSSSFSFICEGLDNLYDFLQENENKDKNELEKAHQMINHILNHTSITK